MLDKEFTPRREDFVVADRSKHQIHKKSEEKIEKSITKQLKFFIKNPSTIVGLSLLFITLLLAFIPPLASNRSVSYSDGLYSYKLPKVDGFENSGFWDGSYEATVNEKRYYSLVSIGAGELDKDGLSFDQTQYQNAKRNPLKKVLKSSSKNEEQFRTVRIDSYYEVGFIYDYVNQETYDQILEYETKANLKVLYPMINTSSFVSKLMYSPLALHGYREFE